MTVSCGQHIHRSTRIQGGREDRGRGTCGWTAKNQTMIHQQHVRSTRWFGDICCCCGSSPVILPAGARIYLAYDTIVMDFSSSRPFHCFLSSIYSNPLQTRSTSYSQYYKLVQYHTVPLGSNLSLLRALSDSFDLSHSHARSRRRVSVRRGEAPLVQGVFLFRLIGCDVPFRALLCVGISLANLGLYCNARFSLFRTL